MGPDHEYYVALLAEAFGGILIIHEAYDLDDHITDCIDSNLKDCTLIGPEAGAELRKMVYG